MNLRAALMLGLSMKLQRDFMRWRRRVWRCCFASSDLPEVLGVADRIVVMREGEIAGELLHEQADERQALSLAMPKVSQAVA